MHWLEEQPGRTWQDRWVASGADAAGNLAWRELAASWLRDTGWASANPRTDFIALGRGVLPLICGDVIRPSLSWLLTPETPKNLAAEMARSRDPGGFAALAALARTDPASAPTKDLAARRIAAILAAKGGTIAGITVGDCLELLDALAAAAAAATPARTSTSCCTRWGSSRRRPRPRSGHSRRPGSWASSSWSTVTPSPASRSAP